MGVTGDVLQRILKTAGRHVDLRKYAANNRKISKRQKRQLRIAVDVCTWVARAIYGHGGMLVDERHMTNYGRAELLQQIEKSDDDNDTSFDWASEAVRIAYVNACTKYVMNKIVRLQEATEADLLIVLDGQTPPVKIQECRLRKRRRKEAEKERDAPVNANNLEKRVKAAKRAGAGSSHAAIIAELTSALRAKEISFLVAPYEADGQLAYLSETGIVDLILTEDSDMLAQNISDGGILYKEDGNGQGILVRQRDLGAMERQPKSLSLPDFSTTMIAAMFVSIGCDYCNSLKGIGSVTARNIVKEVFTTKSEVPLLRLLFTKLYASSSENLTEEQRHQYERRFLKSLFMYQHPLVFCPLRRECILRGTKGDSSKIQPDKELANYPPYALLFQNQELQHSIVGKFPPRHLQTSLAEGWINPRTMKVFSNVEPPQYVLDAVNVVNAECTTPKANHSPNALVSQGGERTKPGISEATIFGQSPAASSKQKEDTSRSENRNGEQQAGEDSAPSSQPCSSQGTRSSAEQSAALLSPQTKASASSSVELLSTLQQPSQSSQLSSPTQSPPQNRGSSP